MRLRTGVRAPFVGLLILAFAFNLGCGSKGKKVESPVAAAAKALEPGGPEPKEEKNAISEQFEEVSVGELAKAYAGRNDAAADEKYKGRRLIAVGRFEKITTDGGELALTIYGAVPGIGKPLPGSYTTFSMNLDGTNREDATIYRLRCIFGDSHRQALAKIERPSGEMKVVGVFQGKSMELRECSLVYVPPAAVISGPTPDWLKNLASIRAEFIGKPAKDVEARYGKADSSRRAIAGRGTEVAKFDELWHYKRGRKYEAGVLTLYLCFSIKNGVVVDVSLAG